VGGSFSRSALNRASGARTRWSGAITGLAVLCFLPFASSLEALPLAVLAALVIGAVAGLVRLAPIARLVRFSKPQFGVAATTFALTLVLAPRVDLAVVIGAALAIAVHLWRELRLELTTWRDGETLHARPRGVLWFGTEGRLEKELLAALARNADARALTVHLDGLGRIDITAALALRALLADARAGGLEVEVTDVRERWQPLVDRVIESDEDPLGRDA
jgi:SulP family sulfate permease